ncbi:LysR family transcriptional regulator [Lysobacter sp. KIS68-7]|uniref:LysR family transcriptional regulator n=1 Tax=Lysobacter sp. KIS68-7 TaxID=2904252 RepID=UPI001E3CBE52|nr:LysR family transcriptional regulator [Lysobacter sp. KIS68-7]UHQ19371.1 LysR family transcriptional regulator [Lysobacter sp. KIS68-7]
MLDISQIALFVHVVRGGSFAEVSRGFDIPPNTISRRIASLEDALGTRLFQRSTRKLTLTTAGRAFYEEVADPIETLEHAGQAVLGEENAISGLIRIAAPVDFFDLFPITWIREFMRANPKIQFDFVLGDAAVDLIAQGVDIAFRAGVLPDSSYVIRKISDACAVLVASPELLNDVSPKAISDLKEMPCIVGSGKQVRSTWRMQGPSGTHEVTVRACFKADSSLAQLRACVAGIGIALLPSGLVRGALSRGELIRVLPEYRLHAGGFYVVLPTRRHVPAAVRHFMQFAIERFENEDRFGLDDSESARRLRGVDKGPSVRRRSSSGATRRRPKRTMA